jgi:ornithine decarboxylase
VTARQLQAIARKEGTPVVVIDHDVIRRNYAAFRRHLPKVQAYYAVKANPAPEIVRTLHRAGASFDVASLPEFQLVYENIKHLPAAERQQYIWDKIVYANPIKPKETLQALDQYRPLVTFDNRAELAKIRQYAPNAGLVLRLRVPNTGSMVELSSKFGCDAGEAVDLIGEAFSSGLVVEGVSFHVGSQCTNFENFVQALQLASAVMRSRLARPRHQDPGYRRRLSGALRPARQAVQRPGAAINAEIARLFPPGIEILADRAVFWSPRRRGCGAGHRQGGPGRPALLLHRRQRLPYLQRHHFRPLPIPFEGIPQRNAGVVRGLRPDLRRAGYHLALGIAAGAGDRRSSIFGKHRGLQQRQFNLVQRISPGKGLSY